MEGIRKPLAFFGCLLPPCHPLHITAREVKKIVPVRDLPSGDPKRRFE